MKIASPRTNMEVQYSGKFYKYIISHDGRTCFISTFAFTIFISFLGI